MAEHRIYDYTLTIGADSSAADAVYDKIHERFKKAEKDELGIKISCNAATFNSELQKILDSNPELETQITIVTTAQEAQKMIQDRFSSVKVDVDLGLDELSQELQNVLKASGEAKAKLREMQGASAGTFSEEEIKKQQQLIYELSKTYDDLNEKRTKLAAHEFDNLLVGIGIPESLKEEYEDFIQDIADGMISASDAAEQLNFKIREFYSDKNNLSLENKSLEELVELYHQLGTSGGASEDLEKISSAILDIVQAEDRLDASKMQNFATILKGLTFVDGDSPITKVPYTVEQAIEALNRIKSFSNESPVSPDINLLNEATEKIKREGEAAEKSAAQKEEFVEANRKVSESGKGTAQSIGQVTESIKQERTAVEEATAKLNAHGNVKPFLDPEVDEAEWNWIVEKAHSYAEELGEIAKIQRNVRKDKVSYEVSGSNGQRISLAQKSDGQWISSRQTIEDNTQAIKENVRAAREAEQAQKAAAKEAEKIAKQEAKETERVAKLQQKLEEGAKKDQADAGTRQNKDAVKAYNSLIHSAQEYYDLQRKEENKTITGTEIQRLQTLRKEWENATNAVEEYRNNIQGAQASQKNWGDTYTAFSQSDLAVAQKYSVELQGIIGKLSDLSNSAKYTESLKNEARELVDEIKQFNAEPLDLKNKEVIAKLAEIDQKVRAVFDKRQLDDFKLATDDMISKLDTKVEKLGNTNSGMGRKFEQELDVIRQKVKALYDQGDEAAFTGLKEALKDLNKLDAAINAAGKTGKSFFAMFKERLKGANAQFLTTYFSLQDIIRYGRQAVQTIIDLDDHLLDLKKTTSMSNSELEAFYYNSNNLAKQLGVTTSEIIDQAAAWSRLGFSSKEEAETMAQLSSMFASISPGTSVSEAQEGLVSMMKSFGLTVDETQRRIMDNVNTLGRYCPNLRKRKGLRYAA